ncbi:TonB-dependent receptor [Flaviaesturariibacter flavus]|uniref:TonB-dependent receptor n=1 Tax=Flaviaesturariibacter flavus TaxID=2502780 RepID=A0A4R1BC95_9BACT|nr:TonB-dependent receptor [Flaviaesturariibacter flavus]TCJ14568.1 TonB-dependent receptor [Flaviaesturariibacter flavus]
MKTLLTTLVLFCAAVVQAQDSTRASSDTSKLSKNKDLQEVRIESMRPAIEQKADKIVVNVENTALAAGNTAYAVLSRTPGVLIDAEGNIQLNGRSGVLVQIDGRPTFLSARDLRTLLEGMPAENLKNIEIITNPSAKYEAEGTSGILNINLKKQVKQGVNGSLYAGYNTNFHNSGWSIGGSLNYRKGGWSFFINTDLMRRVGGRDATFTRVFQSGGKTTYFDQVATASHYNEGPPTFRVGSELELGKRHSIGITTYFNQNTLRQEFLSGTSIGSAPMVPELRVDARNYMMNVWQGWTGNVHYVYKLDSAGSTLSSDFDFARIRNRGDADFLNFYDSVGRGPYTDFLYQESPNGYNIISGRLDATVMAGNGRRVETGLRASDVLSDNDARFYFHNTPELVVDPHRTNHFRYRENIYAAYVNGVIPVGKRLTVQAGLRLEQTISRGMQLTTGQVTNRQYTNLFPSVFLQQKVSENYSVTLNYSRRLQRPNYGNLNPFRLYRDPYTWFEGNPGLQPQYAHSFALTQSIKKTYLITLSYLYTSDIMAELPRLVPDSAYTIYYPGNVSSERECGVTAVIPVKIRRWWDVQNTLTMLADRIDANSKSGGQVNDNVFVMFQSNHTLQLPRGIRLELNGRYVGEGLSGLYVMQPYFRLDAGLRKSFPMAHLDLSVSASDVFQSHRLRFDTRIGDNINNFDQYLRFQGLNIQLRYNFSKGQRVDEQRRRTVEEMGRAGA